MLVGEDVAGWDQDAICVNALAAIWQVEGVVQSEGGFVIGEAVEVPVSLFSSQLAASRPSFGDELT